MHPNITKIQRNKNKIKIVCKDGLIAASNFYQATIVPKHIPPISIDAHVKNRFTPQLYHF